MILQTCKYWYEVKVHTSNGRPAGPLRGESLVPLAVSGGVVTPDMSGANNLPAADANPSGNWRRKKKAQLVSTLPDMCTRTIKGCALRCERHGKKI
jgi:hypothetical protein